MCDLLYVMTAWNTAIYADDTFPHITGGTLLMETFHEKMEENIF